MRLIDADMLEQEVIKRAFEGKLEWSVTDLKQLIREQRSATQYQIACACYQKGMQLVGGYGRYGA